MNGAALGDLGQLHALLVREGTAELEGSLDLVEAHWPILTLDLVGGM